MISDVPLLNRITHYVVKRKGKQMRPMFVFLTAKIISSNEKINEKVYRAASIIELIHTATLIHDDVVDSSDKRRGFFSLNALWKNKIAVLVGDFLYSRAFEIMVEPNSMEIMNILSKATNQISEGEVLQLLNIKNANVTQAEYFKVIERKTACLFKAACQIAGILSSADQKVINAMGSFGMHLGNAFQIIDDTLDYESDSNIIGKEIGDDLSEGKVTLRMIYALEKTKKAENKILKDAIKNADASHIDQIVEILLNVDAFQYSRDIAKIESNRALESIDYLPDSKYKTALKLLCELSLERNS